MWSGLRLRQLLLEKTNSGKSEEAMNILRKAVARTEAALYAIKHGILGRPAGSESCMEAGIFLCEA